MKHLIEFIKESILLEAADAESVVNELRKKESLKDYVNDLNELLTDKDAKEILLNAFVRYKGKDAIDLDGDMKSIPVKNLHPTQNEIDVNASIAWPFKTKENAENNMELFFKGEPVKINFPLITFNDEFILDGHHRWSQTYTFNPDAEMLCFNITQKSGKKTIDEQEALKICQGVLAAKRSIDKKGKIPQELVKGANIFKMSEDDVKNKLKEYCEKDDEIADIIRKAEKVKNNDELADKLCDNLMDLRKHNEKYASKGNNRGDMPQTDKGGNNPGSKKPDPTADPKNKKSALYAMVHGKSDPDVL